MDPVGELRSVDGRWAAVVYAMPNGTFDFRLFEFEARTSAWVEVPGQHGKSIANQREAISEIRRRFPQLAGERYRITPAEDPPESARAIQVRHGFALLGTITIVAGIALLYFDRIAPGIGLLSIGCLSIGWSIGGYRGGGYGASNS